MQTSCADLLCRTRPAGYEAKYGRGGVLSVRAPGQERFTRLRSSTLGEGYGQEDVQAVIGGRAPVPKAQGEAPRKVDLIIDIQARMRTGKGPAYERWAKTTTSNRWPRRFNFCRKAA